MVDVTNPKDMDDDDINKRYRDVWHNAVGNYKTDAEASLLSIEMNRRFLENGAKENHKLSLDNQKLAKENHVLSIQNHKLTKISIGISFLALFIALISALFSYIDWRGDYDWQTQQIKVLQEISKKSSDIAKNQKIINSQLHKSEEKIKTSNITKKDSAIK